MAKKTKKITGKTILIAVVGLTIVAITPLFLLFAGIEVPIIGKVYADAIGIIEQVDPDGLEIPVTEEEQIQTNQEIIDQINNLLCGGGGGTGNPDLIQISSDGTIILDPNQEACIPLGETTSPEEELTPEEIEELIKKLQDMLIDPPIVNQTTSEDPPIEQLCDIEPDNPLCQIISPSNSIQIITKVSKTDSDGMTTVTEEAFEILSFAFLVEDDTDRDFRTGFLNFELFLKGLPNTNYDGTGKVDLFVGQQSIFTEPTIIRVNGMSDNEGMIQVVFVSPTGTTSNDLLFTFDDEFDKFVNEQITLIRLNIVDLTVSDQTENFSLVDQDVFTMDVARDDIKLIITDETGITDRIYPTDSRIVITSKAKTIKGTYCLIRTHLTGQLATGCSLRNLSCPCIGSTIGIGTNNVVAGTTSAPTITGINLFDQNGLLLLSKLGGTGVVFDELVTRNENYTIEILSPIISTDLSFGKPQETQSYTCQAEGTPRHKISITVTGQTDRCGAGGCNYYWWIVTDGISTGKTTCNLP